MRLEAVELRRISLSLVAPFETSFGVQTDRDVLLLKAITDRGEGWGECVAGEDPLYSPEYVDGAQQVLIHHLLPALFERDLSAADVEPILRPVHGHHMAKAAIEMAVLDAELRACGESCGKFFGAVRYEVDCGVSVGMHRFIAELRDTVGAYVEHVYRQIKLLIKPGAYVEGRNVHDLYKARGIPVWMGGMLETGVGRAGNVAMAAMPNFTLPGDTSASDRYYRRDITEPFVLHDGRLKVPKGAGLGVSVDHEFLDSITQWKQTLMTAGLRPVS